MIFSDLVSLTIAFTYVAAIIGIAEILRRGFHLPVEFTRKFVHVGVGMSALVVTIVFRTWYIAVIGPIVFILLNYLSFKYQLFQGIETGLKGQKGTIYFPLAFAILIPLLWSQPEILGVSMMPLTWGDTAAALLGARFGMHKFSFFRQTSSVEGSLAMFLFSLIATCSALFIFGASFGFSMFLATATAFVATLAEMFSPWGIDNLTVPLVSALVLAALNGWSK